MALGPKALRQAQGPVYVQFNKNPFDRLREH